MEVGDYVRIMNPNSIYFKFPGVVREVRSTDLLVVLFKRSKRSKVRRPMWFYITEVELTAALNSVGQYIDDLDIWDELH